MAENLKSDEEFMIKPEFRVNSHGIRIVSLLMAIVIISGSFFLWQGIYLPKDSHLQTQKIFLIEKGQSVKEIAKNLEKENLIKDDFYFILYLWSRGEVKKLQSGFYKLSPAMSIREIAKKLAKGEVIKIEVVIPEGFKIDKIEEEIVEKGLDVKSKIKNQKSKFYKEEFEFLRDIPDEMDIEGYLFPDTYQIVYGSKIEEIVRAMLKNFDKKLTLDLREEIKQQKKTIFEIITMASMIEKEVRTKEDKELVSGILWKRLKQGIPLQVDATIAYITGEQTSKISKTDTQIDSLYNTYKYRGLPLGPISNPGLESILAAIYPKSSEYWYYLSTPDGTTIFSRTLEEHNVAKAKYLK